jgi:hypothetical protein
MIIFQIYLIGLVAIPLLAAIINRYFKWIHTGNLNEFVYGDAENWMVMLFMWPVLGAFLLFLGFLWLLEWIFVPEDPTKKKL